MRRLAETTRYFGWCLPTLDLPRFGGQVSTTQSAGASAIRQERDSLSVRIAAADERIRCEFPQYQSLVVPAPLSATEVQSELQPEEALIYFLQTYDDVFVWAITREKAEWKKLALDVGDIEKQVASLRASLEIFAPMSVPSSERFDLDTAHLLYQHLFSPVALGLAGKQKLIVVTHGSLATLPFQTLVASAPSTGGQRDIAAYADADWLVNRYAISVLPAVTNIKSLRQLRPGSPIRKEMVGFGNPEFQPRTGQPGQHVSRDQATCRVARGLSIEPAELRQLEPLPCTETELLGVGAFMSDWRAGKYWPGDCRIRSIRSSASRHWRRPFESTASRISSTPIREANSPHRALPAS